MSCTILNTKALRHPDTRTILNAYVFLTSSGEDPERILSVLQFSSRLPLRKTEDGKTDLSTVPRLGWHDYTFMFVFWFVSIC